MTFKTYTKIKIVGDKENEGIFDNPEDEIYIDEIAFSKKSVDTLNLKKLVSKRVLEVLKQTIVNNSLNKTERN
jgi:hypothetical protein